MSRAPKPSNKQNNKIIASAIALATITATDDAADDCSVYTTCTVYTVLIDLKLKHASQTRDWDILKAHDPEPGEISGIGGMPRFYFLCSNITSANAQEIRVESEIYTLFMERQRSLPEIGMCLYRPSARNHPKLIARAMQSIQDNKAWIDRTMLATDIIGKLHLLRRMHSTYETLPITDSKQQCVLANYSNSTAPNLYQWRIQVPADSAFCSLDAATLVCTGQLIGFGTMVTSGQVYCNMAITAFHYLELLHANEAFAGFANFPLMLSEKNNPVNGKGSETILPPHIALINIINDSNNVERWQLLATDRVLKVGNRVVEQGNLIVDPIGVCSISVAVAHLYKPDDRLIIQVQREGRTYQLETVLVSMHVGRRLNWSQLSNELPRDFIADSLEFSQMTEERYNIIQGMWGFKEGGYLRELLGNNYGKKVRPLFILMPCRFSDIGQNTVGKPFINDGTGYVLWQVDGTSLTKVSDFQTAFASLNDKTARSITLRGSNNSKLTLERTCGKWLVSA